MPRSYVASAGQEREIIVWNPYTLRRITSLVGHQACIMGIACNDAHRNLISVDDQKEASNEIQTIIHGSRFWRFSSPRTTSASAAAA